MRQETAHRLSDTLDCDDRDCVDSHYACELADQVISGAISFADAADKLRNQAQDYRAQNDADCEREGWDDNGYDDHEDAARAHGVSC